jgi:EAL domain-containing protein (putative c-di-GMP-specific phosphodiesterase class I)
VNLLLRVRDPAFLEKAREAAAQLGARLLPAEAPRADVFFADAASANELHAARVRAQDAGAALVVVVPPDLDVVLLAEAEEWVLPSATVREVAQRLAAAAVRGQTGRRAYEEMLYDRRTGLPTLPVMIEQARELLERRGQLTVLHIHFVWYEKIEELYGWQKLDDVLETTAFAVRGFYAAHETAESIVMVSHVADDDFILFTHVPARAEPAGQSLRAVAQELEEHLRSSIEEKHGEDIAALCGVYAGASTVFANARFRTERLLYRGIREASQAARGAEQWERARRVDDLRATIREGAVFFDYHPIIVTATETVFGYEALARGVRRSLRSPDVLFDVAAEANLVWELSRLLRQRAVQGIREELDPGQVLFLNVDPHDFDDPAFRGLDAEALGIEDPGRVVFEITERTAIRDYPRFREYLATFRSRGFRFAVDDAGSGYAGLGTIANLAPDFIKLDISLIANIDGNPLKQNIVGTMVGIADAHGAQVVAEGVERQEEFQTIRSLGVHYSQGFLFHGPRGASGPSHGVRSSAGAPGHA